LISKGYEREEIVKAGLAIKKETSNTQHPTPNIQSYDRFRGRIIFPVFDLNFQVIGFGGRIFSVNQRINQRESAVDIAKYINTPNTLLYDKSWVLYGLNFAKVEVRMKDACILVEGYTDVILSHQAGFQNTVATSGTALTPFQLKILKRYSQNLITAFDMDIAGDSATRRGIDLAQKEDFQIKVITMPSGTDPADIISKDPKKWEKLIDSAKSILDFYFESAFSKFDKNLAEGKRGISNILLTVIARIPNKISQSHWLQELSGKLKVSEESVLEELRKVLNKRGKEYKEPSIPEEDKALKEEKTRRGILEEKILSLVLKLPVKLELLDKDYFSLFSPKSKEILVFLKKGKSKVPPDIKEFLDVLALMSEIEEDLDPEQEFQLCLKELETLVIKDKLQGISKEIREAEESKDEKRIKELMKEFNESAKKLNNLQ
jgi:DNA primase